MSGTWVSFEEFFAAWPDPELARPARVAVIFTREVEVRFDPNEPGPLLENVIPID